MGIMSAKAARLLSKRNATIEEILEKYNFETADELLSSLRRNCPENAEELFKQFQRNSKKKNSAKKHSGTNTVKAIITEPEVVMVEAQETVSSENVEAEALENQEKVDMNEEQIAELKEMEAELSAYCVSLEAEHKKFVARRAEIVRELEGVKKVLSELQRLLNANHEKMIPLVEEYNSIGECMLEKSGEIAKVKTELETVRSKLDDLTKVIFLVYAGGTIEIENAPNVVEVSESEIAALTAKLIMEPEAESCTIKMIKTIAKVILMSKQYETFEVLCDTTEAQQLYEKAVAIV